MDHVSRLLLACARAAAKTASANAFADADAELEQLGYEQIGVGEGEVNVIRGATNPPSETTKTVPTQRSNEDRSWIELLT